MKELDELTTKCIRCGFCLESCPTFVVTGRETESPRGRIYLVRSADEGQLDWEATREHIGTCLGCRACETACPSGVQYGKILELARDELERKKPHGAKRMLLGGMTRPNRMRMQLFLSRLLPGRRIPLTLSKLLSGEAPEADRPRVQSPAEWKPLQEAELPPIRGHIYLLEGCVMKVMFPRVHEATRRLLRRVGFEVRKTDAGCCGALHAHNGYLTDAQDMARKLFKQMPENLPVIVNSAGCGSWMKDFLRDEGSSGQVVDVSEFLMREGLIEQLTSAPGLQLTATYHDACHLAHGQGIRLEPRRLLEAVPGLELRPLGEADMCCGSAGIYNVMQPSLARTLLERKWANVEATGAQVVVSGNPGCHAWIEQASREHGGAVRVLHTAELLEAAFSGLP
jgi:glycolate oxidase iron-sulfur subunit